MKQLLVELTAGFDELPPQLKEAARWVIDHPADVALLTMREQARRAGIPPATLTRLAQRFRLKGYDEIRKLYAEAVRQRPESYRGRAEELLQRRDSEGDEALI
jgi:DNA-binding MurR/RpiR family transcriptional regulator